MSLHSTVSDGGDYQQLRPISLSEWPRIAGGRVFRHDLRLNSLFQNLSIWLALSARIMVKSYSPEFDHHCRDLSIGPCLLASKVNPFVEGQDCDPVSNLDFRGNIPVVDCILRFPFPNPLFQGERWKDWDHATTALKVSDESQSLKFISHDNVTID
jgi:hypothetical protein